MLVQNRSPASLQIFHFCPNRLVRERVASWEDLPAGGDYDYTADGTFYAGEDCGRWKLLDDGQFEKIEG